MRSDPNSVGPLDLLAGTGCTVRDLSIRAEVMVTSGQFFFTYSLQRAAFDG